MNIIKVVKNRLTVQEAAELLGLKSFDTALPQIWLDDILLRMSITPCSKTFPENWKDLVLSGLVWCYDPDDKGSPSLFGYPVALTTKTLDLLTRACPRQIWDFTEQKAILEVFPEPTALDKAQLAKEEGAWDYEHEDFPRQDWRDNVISKDTQLGYFDWVIHNLEDQS